MSSYVTRTAENIPYFNIDHNFYKNYFFPLTIIEWNNQDSNLCYSENFGIFKNIFTNLLDTKQTVLTTAITRGLTRSHDSD